MGADPSTGAHAPSCRAVNRAYGGSGRDSAMSRALRFIVLLVLGLAGLTWGTYVVVRDSTGAWYEKDVNLRARLALNGARAILAERWNVPARLEQLLVELAQDERIMGACACSPEGVLIAATPDFPPELTRRELLARAATEGPNPQWGHWASRVALPDGDVHLAALPVAEDGRELGYVVLAHDLSFVARRDAKMRVFLLGVFAVLALAASAMTLVASRMSWRDWSEE